MSAFEDELLRIAPGLSIGCKTTLERTYGASTGFCAGLDVFTRIVQKNAIAKQIPAFGEPWKGIYLDILQEVQRGGVQFPDALQTALQKNGRPAFALYEAIIHCKNELDRKSKNSSKLTAEDYQTELKVLGYDLKLNLCGMHIEVNGHTMTDYDDSEIRMQMEDAGYKTKQRITDAIMTSAKENEYHPIKDYLSALVWDGVPRIYSLARCFEVKDPQYAGLFPNMLRKWLIGAIARVFNGEQNPMLILEGPQGCGKGTFTRWLCPDRRYHRESSIDPDNKDHRIATSEIWIWEVGEVGSTTKKADREALKSFLTTDIFVERAPYGKFNQPYRAMSSFIGTVNDDSGFLNDPTGARRFWSIGIRRIDFSYSKTLSVDDIWAEAMYAYQHGESHDLDAAQKNMVAAITEDYKMVNSTEEAIKKWFDITNDPNDFLDFNAIREILQDPQKGSLPQKDLTDIKIASALKSLGLERCRKYIYQTALGHSKRVLMRGYLGIKTL